MLAPVVLAKLWSVIPKLFAWSPVRSLTHALERISLLLLVGSTLFEFATGILNIQYDYVFGFSFYTGHYIGARGSSSPRSSRTSRSNSPPWCARAAVPLPAPRTGHLARRHRA
ncbi:hypothetical protein [Amycolatopsis methanolica]|uniref:hypothetical protein n=1 Tax=Amycolatopsis methanolica TaxID=1814 RepID=UPI0003A147A1|nr:hypothetical protein [Amycolatopsis methanolica]